jgi:hypothetical protein
MKSCKHDFLAAGAILIAAVVPAKAQDFPSLILSNSPIDYWQFAETNASPPIDLVSNYGSAGAAATGYLDGAIRGQSGGIVGNCVAFTNTGQDAWFCYSRLDIPNLPALNPEPPFTIEFWARVNEPFDPVNDSTPPAGLCPLASDSPFPYDSSRSGYLFYALPGSWEIRVGGEGGYTAVADWHGSVDGSWQHIVGEFDGTYLTIYVNGVEGTVVNTPGANLAIPGPPFHPNGYVPTRIGGTELSGSEYMDYYGDEFYPDGNRGWDGGIDEVAIYNALLSSNTILAHYSMALTNPSGYGSLVLASSPVGYWNFDEPSYTPPNPGAYTAAIDSGSLADNGVNTSGTLADQPGVPDLSATNRSVAYNGAIGSLVLDANLPAQYFGDPVNGPGPGVGNAITLAAWIKPRSFDYVSDIIAQGFDLTTYAENFLRVGNAFDWEVYSDDTSLGDYNPVVQPDTVYYQVGTYDGNGAGYNDAAYPAPPGDIGNWVFLAGTYDGTNWNLYRNGVLVNSFSDYTGVVDGYPETNPGEGPSGLTEPWSVGSCSSPSPYFGMFFDGSIEEAAIFTNALGADTISNLYQSVHQPPVITQAPQVPLASYLGSEADLSVWAEGPGTLAYQWYSNSVAMTGQTATNISLTNLTAAAAGTYSVVVTNAYGSVTSSVALYVTPTLPPATLVPASESRWVGFPLSFAPASLPNQPLSFQWYFNGAAISGATQSNYSAACSNGSVGTYTLVLSNSLGTSTSSPALFTAAMPHPAGYASNVLENGPIAYLPLDETNGTVAYDYAGGNNGNYYDVELGQPGFSPVNPDLAATFLGMANSYVGDIGATTINFAGTNAAFSIEAWANGGPYQINGAAVVVKGSGDNGTSSSEQFAIDVQGSVYRFYVTDSNSEIYEVDAPTGPDGNWHYLAGIYSGAGNYMDFYIDGALVASAQPPATGTRTSSDPVSIGAERSGLNSTYDWAYSGSISQVAIYPYALSADQVEGHCIYCIGPVDVPPIIELQPVSTTNYYNLPATLSVGVIGTMPLSYQWIKAGAGPVPDATNSELTIPNLDYTAAGTYTVSITNTIDGTNYGVLSDPATITVLPPPASPPAIPGLVMHLTFDHTLEDATGRGNNATNKASGTAMLATNDYSPGMLGYAFSYQTTVTATSTNANYASVGVRPDLQFGSNINFTASMWVRLPANYTGIDLPFFTDVIGSTFGYPGYVFAPSYGIPVPGGPLGWPGGWGYSIRDNAGNGLGAYGSENSINDGQWHNLIYVINRTTGVTVYLDGVVAQPHNEEFPTGQIGDIDSIQPATIGQDPTGLYPAPGSCDIDDLGVWQTALTPLEAASIFEAGYYSQLSFTGAPLSFSFATFPSQAVQLTWNEGSLQSATNLPGPWTTVSGPGTSPYTISTTDAPQTFFRAKF